MADVLFPPHLRIARLSTRYIDSTGVSIGEFTGAKKTASKGGDRLGASLEIVPTGGTSTDGLSERASLLSFLHRIRGKQNRIIAAESGYTRRGSFPSTELLTNNTFSNGTTGWAAASSGLSISVNDRVMRVKRNQAYATADLVNPSAGATVIQYAAYAARVAEIIGRGSWSNVGLQVGSSSGAQDFATTAAVGGLKTVAFVPSFTSAFVGLVDLQATTMLAGDYYGVPYMSLARCAIADNAPNALLRSDEFDNASWTKTNITATANTHTAPDGNTTADQLLETVTNGSHFPIQAVTVSSSAADYAFAVAVKGINRQWISLQMQEGTGSTLAAATFDVTNGVVGSSTSTGANWSNLRRFIVPLGSNWYYCSIVARKTNAATSISPLAGSQSGDNFTNFAGNTSNGIALWRATLAQSSVPTRLAQTTSTASTGTSQAGSALYVKGLPASTSGLLLEGDLVEVITSYGSELKRVTAPLDSNDAGLGYLQFEPPLRGTPADNAAVIVNEPMGRFILASDAPQWTNEPGIFTSATLDLEEA